MIDPAKREIDLRPDRFDEVEILCRLEIRTRKHDEKRRRIDTAIIAIERYLPQRGHFAFPGLMENFSRLRVPLWIFPSRLSRSQIRKHSPCNIWIDPQIFERRDDAVATERSAEPWHSRVGIKAIGRRGEHHVQIGGRLCQPVIKLLVRGGDLRIVILLCAQITLRFRVRTVVVRDDEYRTTPLYFTLISDCKLMS